MTSKIDAAQAQISRLQDEADEYTRKIETQRQRLGVLDQQVLRLLLLVLVLIVVLVVLLVAALVVLLALPLLPPPPPPPPLLLPPPPPPLTAALRSPSCGWRRRTSTCRRRAWGA